MNTNEIFLTLKNRMRARTRNVICLLNKHFYSISISHPDLKKQKNRAKIWI